MFSRYDKVFLWGWHINKSVNHFFGSQTNYLVLKKLLKHFNARKTIICLLNAHPPLGKVYRSDEDSSYNIKFQLYPHLEISVFNISSKLHRFTFKNTKVTFKNTKMAEKTGCDYSRMKWICSYICTVFLLRVTKYELHIQFDIKKSHGM